MSAESDLRRWRAQANRLRSDISKASSTVAAQRKKAASATAAAGKSNSASTVRMKLAEAERATKAANEAEGKRAALEKNLADVETKISKAQERYDKERNTAQEKAFDTLRRRADRASVQFRPPQLAGWDDGSDATPGSSALATQLPRVPACDVFLSHASEDKDEIARPLKDALATLGR